MTTIRVQIIVKPESPASPQATLGLVIPFLAVLGVVPTKVTTRLLNSNKGEELADMIGEVDAEVPLNVSQALACLTRLRKRLAGACADAQVRCATFIIQGEPSS